MSDVVDLPVLVAFVSDLMFAPRIEDAALRSGFRSVFFGRVRDIPGLEESPAAPDPQQPERIWAEPVKGPAAVLIDLLTRLRPSLMIFDLGNQEIPWAEWLPLIKSAPATRRYPVVCFGSHVDGDTLRKARDRGAEAVMARSAFFGSLPATIEKYARRVDAAAIAETCREPLSATALHGLELFNHGEYFEAHEILETAWNQDASLGRDLYRGILQVAVAYLQIERGNFTGALKMFLRMRQWLDVLPGECRGVNVERLRQDARLAHDHLTALGPERISQFDRSLFRPVVYNAPGEGEQEQT